jgi:hypothetical protein
MAKFAAELRPVQWGARNWVFCDSDVTGTVRSRNPQVLECSGNVTQRYTHANAVFDY